MKYIVKILTRTKLDKSAMEVEGILEIIESTLDDEKVNELVVMAEMQANGDNASYGSLFPVRVHITKRE